MGPEESSLIRKPSAIQKGKKMIIPKKDTIISKVLFIAFKFEPKVRIKHQSIGIV